MAESIGNLYSTQIPSLSETADIQEAFRLYHYGAPAGTGSGEYDPTNSNPALLVNPSIAYSLNNLQSQITAISGSLGVQATVWTTKGDLVTRTSSPGVVRFGVGADGTVLTANSAEATGLQWASLPVTLTNTVTLTNKTISGLNNTLTNIANVSLVNSSFIIGSTSVSLGDTAATIAGLTLTTPTISSILNTGTLTLPTSTDTIVGRATTDTLTNKTINGSNNTITNISLTTAVTGTLPVANGGTGITSLGAGIATFLGTPSSANLASAITDETGTGALVFGTSPTITPAEGTTTTATTGAGYMGMPQVSTGTSRTFAATDAGKHIYVTSTGQTLTIPANGTVAFPIGTTIVVVNASGVSTSIGITSDTLRLANSSSTGTRTLASNGMCTLLKIAATTWIASGNGLT